ncbi:MAG: site-2 protease family protein [Chloroflexi bacterium]|nr:site-2 protease family protein [Chloroflexota bacterium]
MLNEPASSIHDRRPQPAADESLAHIIGGNPELDAVRVAVMQVMAIEAERTPESLRPGEAGGGTIVLMMPEPKLLVRFDGRLTVESEAAYAMLDATCKPLEMTPVMREVGGRQHVYIVSGRTKPEPRGVTWNVVLFIATLISVLYVGTLMAINEIGFENPFRALVLAQDPWSEILRGIPYAASILLILGAHELGHYFAARRRHVAVTLPYFLPFPWGMFGTFGAFIQLREPMRNRKVLFEIGAAGPLAGLVFAIPILLIGLATSPTGPIAPGLIEGNSLVYAISKRLIFGEWLPSARIDVYLNSLAWAGWTGLFVTGLNLMPIGQLDGGHVLYSLIGERAKQFYLPVIALLAALTIFTNGGMLLILVLLVLFGRAHAVPLDNVTQLDPRRRLFAIATLVIFALVFVPVPLTVRESAGLFDFSPSAWSGAVAVGLVLLRRLRR